MSTVGKVVKSIFYSVCIGGLTFVLYTFVQPIEEGSDALKDMPVYRSRKTPEALAKQKAFGNALKAAAESKHPIYRPPPKDIRSNE